MAKRACRKEKALTEGSSCEICGGSDLTIVWKGRIYVLNPDRSEVAKRLGITKQGEFALRIG